MEPNTIITDYVNFVVAGLKEQGVEAVASLDAIREKTAERMAHLSTITAEPGFDEAAKAEAVTIALFAANEAITNADALDARKLEWWTGALVFASRLISPV